MLKIWYLTAGFWTFGRWLHIYPHLNYSSSSSILLSAEASIYTILKRFIICTDVCVRWQAAQLRRQRAPSPLNRHSDMCCSAIGGLQLLDNACGTRCPLNYDDTTMSESWKCGWRQRCFVTFSWERCLEIILFTYSLTYASNAKHAHYIIHFWFIWTADRTSQWTTNTIRSASVHLY